MSRIAYVNGSYVPHRHATVHIEDRGYQLADGVYEVIAVSRGRMVDADGHLQRLARSLGELRIAAPVGDAALAFILGEVIRRNRVEEGIVYLQVTRGVARREHAFPAAASPSLVVTARSLRANPAQARAGVSVVTLPDIRWQRCDIKSVALLPNVLAKQAAREAGAYEAWQVDRDGFVTEGASSNAWIVTEAGEIVTRQASPAILNGITRLAAKRLAAEVQLKIVERPFTVAEALKAREAFITSTTALVMPVVRIDGKPVGDGRPGVVATRLRERYLDFVRRETEPEALA